MKKTLLIIAGVITLLGVVVALITYFWKMDLEPEVESPPKEDWGEGKNPFEPGDVRYGNWEKIYRKKNGYADKIIKDLKIEDDGEQEIEAVEDEAGEG